MEEIIISPEYKKLIEDIKKLKDEISILYEEKHQLIYHECRNIETEYMSKIGTLEYKVYEFQCKLLRIKRKIELYQMYINRQEEIDEKAIEEKLDREYKEYEEKLEQMSENLRNALDRVNGKVLTEEDAEELKRIYRKLIKKLHPDLNKDSTEKDLELLLQVTKAYENGDLTTLKNLELLASEIIEKEKIEINEFEEMKETKQKYEGIVKSILQNIEEIKTKYPYNKKEFLKDEKLIEEKKKELNEIMENYKKLYEEMNNVLTMLKGEIK